MNIEMEAHGVMRQKRKAHDHTSRLPTVLTELASFAAFRCAGMHLRGVGDLSSEII